MANDEIREKLSRSLPFWKVLPDEDKDLIERSTTPTVFAKGETIRGHTAECLGGFVVLSGSVRVYLLSEQGREVTISRLRKDEPCLLGASCVLHSIAFDVMMEAEEPTECLIIAPDALRHVFDRNPKAENYALNILVDRFSDIMWTMQQVLFMSFDKRLAIFLYEESARTGENTIHATQEQVAKHLGSAREVVSRMLGYFAREGMVEVGRGTIKLVDRDRLKQLALS